MCVLDLTTVSQTRQTKPINGWVYRIVEDKNGALLMRVPEANQLWGHGVYKQVYDAMNDCFVQTNQADPYIYSNPIDLAAAVEVIVSQKVSA